MKAETMVAHWAPLKAELMAELMVEKTALRMVERTVEMMELMWAAA
jgi:hypothetical protein